MYIAWSCDANGLTTPGLKFPQQNGILGGTTLNICSIFLSKGHKVLKMERTTFLLPSLRSSCSSRKKLTHLLPLVFMKTQENRKYFLLFAHSWIEKKPSARSKQLTPSTDSKNVAVFLNVRQAQPGRLIFTQDLSSEATDQGTLI